MSDCGGAREGALEALLGRLFGGESDDFRRVCKKLDPRIPGALPGKGTSEAEIFAQAIIIIENRGLTRAFFALLHDERENQSAEITPVYDRYFPRPVRPVDDITEQLLGEPPSITVPGGQPLPLCIVARDTRVTWPSAPTEVDDPHLPRQPCDLSNTPPAPPVLSVRPPNFLRYAGTHRGLTLDLQALTTTLPILLVDDRSGRRMTRMHVGPGTIEDGRLAFTLTGGDQFKVRTVAGRLILISFPRARIPDTLFWFKD
jgi:hypothetical protein